MINTQMRAYNYYTLGTDNAYGQPQITANPQGTIRMSINITSQSIQDNINYKAATYIGLTFAPVDDTYIIEYGEQKLKVLYVNSLGRYNQVFLAEI